MITQETKAMIVKKYGDSPKDSGKPEVQVALLTARIIDLTGHVTANKKDVHSRRGLISLVNKRRTLLNYLAKNDITRYRTIIGELNLRK
ncbi:MAG: 30S ribosomal protein S15 [Candidatus Kapaibacterium sp.]|jgi:small subunit ribosomal protein S15